MFIELVLLFVVSLAFPHTSAFIVSHAVRCAARGTSLPATAPKGIKIPKIDQKLTFALGKVAFSLLPLSPESTGRRKTILKEVVKGQVWTLEQVQGIINVNVPVRSTVIKLKSGGLFINNPVAPTEECLSMIRRIESLHGDVKYIALSTLGVEHKGTTGVFARNFPRAEVFIQPGQYTFPVKLPTFLFFAPGTKIREIPADFRSAPWNDDIEHIVLSPLVPKGVGGFSETAFFHKKTKTLLVTDLVIQVDPEPPAIIQVTSILLDFVFSIVPYT
jgi:hypothetical protein